MKSSAKNFNIEILFFDLGVGSELLDYTSPSTKSPKYNPYEEKEILSHFGQVFTNAKHAMEVIGYPTWLVSSMLAINESARKTIGDDYGEENVDFYFLGKNVWRIANNHTKLGISQEIKKTCLNLNIQGVFNSVISQWVTQNATSRIDDEKVFFINNVRRAIISELRYRNMIFLSHSHKDAELAHEICTEIELNNLKCFLAPRDLQSGEHFSEAIRDALRRSKELIIIITPNSISSKWVILEAGSAWGAGKTINIGYAYISMKDLPEALASIQAINIETVKGRNRLINDICSRITNDSSI